MNEKKLTLKGHQAYMDASQGPFRCDNCEYYPTANTCNNKKVISWAERGLYGLTMNGSNARVEPGSCSDEFKRK